MGKISVIVAGGRDFNDYAFMTKTLKNLFQNYHYKDITIIGGEADGADKLGKRFAKENGIEYLSFPADWDNLDATPCKIKVNKQGKKYNALAGLNRNIDMSWAATHCICFWDGKSTGTKHMIDTAKERFLILRVIKYKKIDTLSFN